MSTFSPSVQWTPPAHGAAAAGYKSERRNVARMRSPDDNSTLKYLISHAHVSLHWDKIEDSVQARPETMDGYMNKMW